MDSHDSKDASGPAGLCGNCCHVRAIPGNHGNVYYLCRLSTVDPRYVRYPALPVTDCGGFLPRAPAVEASGICYSGTHRTGSLN